jgi:uncharacterized protein (DUF1810 family)
MIDWYGSKTPVRPAPRRPLPAADSLQRFHSAQATQGHFDKAYREIQRGRKHTHWMWFVFPQLRALGKSETARYFGIADLAEARAYLGDPILAGRLARCTIAVLSHKRLMFEHPDNHKLRACMTLFAKVVEDPTLPLAVLEKFYAGMQDQLTLDVLAGKKITLPSPRRVDVGKHWEKQVASARAAVDSVGARRERNEPMLRSEVESFVRGFNLSAAATRRMVDEWMADRGRAVSVAWDEAYDSCQG